MGAHFSKRREAELREALANADWYGSAVAVGVGAGTKAHLRDGVPFEVDPVARYVVLHHPDGLELAQIGQVLGMPKSSVHATLKAAIRKLEGVCTNTVDGRKWAAAVRHLLEAKGRAERDEYDIHG